MNPFTLEVAAPTLNRPEKLARMLASIEVGGYPCTPRIGYETEPRPLQACVNDLLRASEADIVIVGADDLEFLPGSLAAVAAAFEQHFPDLDGYVGLNLTNQPPIPDCTEFAFFAVGRRFMDRFPDRTLFCPEYWHFSSDTELGLYAKSVGKFHHALDARVVHHHPGFSRDPADDTHAISRSRKQQDARIRQRRRELGLIWGASFERVTDPAGAVPGMPMAEAIALAFGDDGKHWACLAGEGERKLCRLVEGVLNVGEPVVVARDTGERICLTAEGKRPRIVEIGAHQGVSACMLARYGDVVTFDIKDWPLFGPITEHFRPTYGGTIERRIVKDNADLSRRLADMEFDLAFIDGCHDYEPVKQNFEAVRKCGRVLFHDYEHAGFKDRVVRFVDQLSEGRTTKWRPFALWESPAVWSGGDAREGDR